MNQLRKQREEGRGFPDKAEQFSSLAKGQQTPLHLCPMCFKIRKSELEEPLTTSSTASLTSHHLFALYPTSKFPQHYPHPFHLNDTIPFPACRTRRFLKVARKYCFIVKRFRRNQIVNFPRLALKSSWELPKASRIRTDTIENSKSKTPWNSLPQLLYQIGIANNLKN